MSSAGQGSRKKGSFISEGKLYDRVDRRLNAHEFGGEFELRIMQERMGERYKKGPSSRMDNRGLLFIHHSLAVRFGNGKWIKAEKGGDTRNNNGGIKVFVVEGIEDPEMWKDDGDDRPGRYSNRFTTGRINLGVGREKWTVEKLRHLLASSDNCHYNVLSSNCWKYANLSARAILKWIIANTLDKRVKTIIEEKLKELTEVERTMPGELAKAFLTPYRAKSRQVLQRTKQRLTATKEALRNKSLFRFMGVGLLKDFLGLAHSVGRRLN